MRNEKNALVEKDMEEQKKTFQKELLDMHTIVKQMRNEKTSNEKLIKTKDTKLRELSNEVNTKKNKLNSFETENKVLREESSRKLNEMENILKEKNRELEDVIMQDLDIIEKDREEISNLTSKIESMEREKRME